MCARWPTIAMSKLLFSVWTKLLPLHGCDVMRFGVMCLWFDLLSSDVASCEVICGTTPVLLCTTKNYNVLLQYYSNVLLCTTKYYASTTLYYNVLLQYYSVLQSTTLYYTVLCQYYASITPVLLCTTKYYSVLQSTTPVPLCTTKYYASTTLYCAAQQESPSNFTKYCACHAKWMSSMICVTYESSFPMRGASKVSLQPHQILRLPHKMNVIDDLRHIWKLISNAWSKSSHPPTSPNTAPARQNECQEWFASPVKPHFQCLEPVKSPPNLTKYCTCHTKSMSSVICVTYETSFPMRGASQVTLQPHQILRLPRNLEGQDLRGKSLKCFRQ